MIALRDSVKMSPQEYLSWEAEQSYKYEYLHGEVYAMTGGTLPHNDVAVNLTTILRTHLRGSRCKVRMSDAKVCVSESGPFFYPDVVVSCDERDRQARDMVRYPCLIIEVLSPSTEAFDRGEKFRQYRRLPSLQEYVLMSADTMMVEVFRLNEQRKWELTPYSLDASGDSGLVTDTDTAVNELTIELTSVGYQGAIALLYEDVELSQFKPFSASEGQ